VQTLASDHCADWLRRAARAALLVIGLSSFTVPGVGVSATVPAAGAWLIDGTGAAVEIFDCNGQLCGRIVWLRTARDSVGRLARDDKNPDPVFRQRPLCGLTVLQGLQSAGLDRWNSGWLYNPSDGQTYRVSAELRSADVFLARIYLGVPLFGETKTLLRVPRLRSEGWC
jgi:uncharacterized protein (DUF2147 family)